MTSPISCLRPLRMRRPGHALSRRSRGAALPIFVLALFPLVAGFYVIHGIGWKLTNRTITQNAADRAAFSAAAVTADALNRVAFLNSALVSVKAMQSILDGVSFAYTPLTAYDCITCAVTGSPYHCKLCGKMLGNAGKVFSGIADNRSRLSDLEKMIVKTSDKVIERTARDASRAGEEAAMEAGVDQAFIVAYGSVEGGSGGDGIGSIRLKPLPLTEPKDGFGGRMLAMAGTLYTVHLIAQEPVQFGAPEHFLGFMGATGLDVWGTSHAGFRTLDFPDPTAQRSALTVTAFVSRDAHDEPILGRLTAVHAHDQNTGLDTFRAADIAVARAEPFFSVNDGEDDGRPAWRARLRPLELPGETGGNTIKAAFLRASPGQLVGGNALFAQAAKPLLLGAELVQ